jgi:hypothetical protein
MSINPLTMQLNGVLDAAVMGGTENYRKAFFTSSYLEANPQNEGLVAELQRCDCPTTNINFSLTLTLLVFPWCPLVNPQNESLCG